MKNRKSGILSVMGISLPLVAVVLYLLTAFQHGATHFFEHDHTEVCSAEAENDPCHRRLVHHDIVDGCDHQTHIAERNEHCDLCHALLTNHHQYFQKSTVLVVEAVISSNNSNPVSAFPTCYREFSSARAPPA